MLTDPPQADAVAMLRASLEAASDIVAIDGLNPDALRNAADAQAIGGYSVSPDGTIGLITVRFHPDLESGPELIEQLESAGNAAVQQFGSDTLRVEFGGILYGRDETETGIGEAAGLVAAMIILLVAFGSLIAMSLPIGLALFGSSIGVFGVMGLVAIGMAVPDFAPSTASMVGLGVGIDYVLFIVTRYREALREGLTVPDAIGRANATAGLAVVFAGGTVVIAILGLAMAGIPFLTATAVSVSVVIALMVAASVTILPAFLGWVGQRIVPRRERRRQASSDRTERSGTTADEHANWQRWGNHVSNHAVKYSIGTVVLLVALTAPVLWIHLGYPDLSNDPPESTARQAYDLLAAGFGPGFNGPLLIAADTNGTTAAELDALGAAIAADPGIAAISPRVLSPTGNAATMTAFPTSSPQDAATFDTLHRLRSEVFPAVLERPEAVHIGGAIATITDVDARVADRLIVFIAAVIILSFLLLIVVFRSILVPLKAAILNLLSIGAAYGVLVAVFNWRWGLSLATAIAVDASIVRMVLVPASMRLMGDTNWWFPRWLEWLPRFDIEGEQSLAPREYVHAEIEAS